MFTAVSYEKTGRKSFSVKLKRREDNRNYWFDVWLEDRDVTGDWNQYIFWTSDTEDQERKTIQDDPEEFDEAISEAIDYLVQKAEIIQDTNGEWMIY